MRITADVKSEQLATVMADSASDRHVPVGMFVPVATEFVSQPFQHVAVAYAAGMQTVLHGLLKAPMQLVLYYRVLVSWLYLVAAQPTAPEDAPQAARP